MIDTHGLKCHDPRPFLESVYGMSFEGKTALCPFHPDKNTLSFSVYQNGDGAFAWKCHGCGASGDVIAFVQKFDGVDFKTAAIKFSEWARIPAVPDKPAAAMKAIAPAPGPAAAARKASLGTFVEAYTYLDAQRRELYQVHRFKEPKTFRPDRKVPAELRVLYHLDEVLRDDTIWIVEGEKDADNARKLGLVATCWPFGVNAWRSHYAEALKGKDVIISLDRGYRAEEERAARDIVKVAKSVRIVELPGLTKKDQDISDWIEMHDAQEPEDLQAELERIAAAAPYYGEEFPEAQPAPSAGQAPDDADAPMTLMLSDVEAKEVPWLWPGYIPLGRATLISGDPGSAKTWFLLNLAARLSKGEPWPDGAAGSGPAQTYYLTVEDDLADTVRPRINSLGGDPSMIAAFNSETPLHLNLADPEGLKRLEAEIVRLGNVRLVVPDPIIDFSGTTNPNAGEEVRALLNPLIKLAAKHNFALVLIGHLNKAQTMSAIYRAGGSTSGWLGKCRAAFMIFRDKDDKPLRHVIPVKANLARQDPPQLEFRIDCGRLDIKISDEDIDIDEQLNPQRGPKPREREDAVSWLRDYFVAREEIPAAEIEEAARVNGISESTLKRAKKQAGYRSIKRSESGGRTVWAWARGPKLL